MSSALSNRLGKELRQLLTSPPEGVKVHQDESGADLRVWRVQVHSFPALLLFEPIRLQKVPIKFGECRPVHSQVIKVPYLLSESCQSE